MTRVRHLPKAFGISSSSFAGLFICLLCFLTVSPGLYAQKIIKEVGSANHGGELVVARNKSEVIRLDVPYKDLLIGNPKVADVITLTDRSIYILGKELGVTSLRIFGSNKRLITVVNIVVSHDVEGLKTRLHDVFPQEKIQVRSAASSILLSGTVSSSAKLARVIAIAKQYAPEPAQVVNGLTVKGSQQVMLAVRFAEVSRTVTKQLGLNSQLNGKNFSFLSGDGFGPKGLISPFVASILGPATFGTTSFTAFFDALEEKGLMKTLAEPNLIALSGDTANFLAGGEFPIPVSRSLENGGTTITVEFKPFGVALAFTPTVLEGDLINVVAAPEVSRVDDTNAVRINGFSIPGLSTRRARTTVELRHGQSFAIAGMIQSDFDDTLREVPLFNKAPILSTLFRSTQFQRNETELVIIVTPYLVKPAEPGMLTDPTKQIALPSDVDMTMFGRTEAKPGSKKASGSAQLPLAAQGAGGIEGEYGHILP